MCIKRAGGIPVVTAGGDDPPGPPQVAQDPGGGHLPHLEPGHNSRAPRRTLLQTVQSAEVKGRILLDKTN